MSEARAMLAKMEASADWKTLVDLALADPPNAYPLHTVYSIWRDEFISVHRRPPSTRSEFPPLVADFLARISVGASPRRGRPRCNEQRIRASWRAWAEAWLSMEYEVRRHIISNALDDCEVYGFDNATIKGDKPSILAIESLADDLEISPRRLEDIIGLHKKKI